jgi:hypothetical protein
LARQVTLSRLKSAGWSRPGTHDLALPTHARLRG